MAFLLTILEPGAFVVFQHAMPTAKVPGAETAVADDALGWRVAGFVRAALDAGFAGRGRGGCGGCGRGGGRRSGV